VRVLALVALLCGAACQQAPTVKDGRNARGGDSALTNPPGRYQMQRGVNPASVAVLDTRYGTVQNCFLLKFRYHCLAQTSATSVEGGLKENEAGPPVAPADTGTGPAPPDNERAQPPAGVGTER